MDRRRNQRPLIPIAKDALTTARSSVMPAAAIALIAASLGDPVMRKANTTFYATSTTR